jgi:hypothetical protein
MPRADNVAPPQDVGEGIPRMVAGAVNLSLAAELCLKAALICLGVRPQKTHDLGRLYGQLPTQVRDSLSSEFDGYLEQVPEESSAFQGLTFSYGPDTERLLSKARARRDHSQTNPPLEGVLRSHADTFQLWRYTHEVPRSGEAAYQYDFYRVMCATDLLRQVAEQIAEKRGLVIKTEKGEPRDGWGRTGGAV